MIGLLSLVFPIILTSINIAGMRSGKASPADHVNYSADRNTFCPISVFSVEVKVFGA